MPKPAREGKWFDGEVANWYVPFEEQTPTKNPRRVWRLALSMLRVVENDIVAEFFRRKNYLLDCSTKIGVPMAMDQQGGM